MELLIESNTWLILIGVGLIAGFIDAVVGGGGLLSIPSLLMLGIPPHIALGTNKLAACFGSFIAAYTYFKQNLFKPSLWYYTSIATFLGAISGTFAVYLINTANLEKLLPLIIIAMALYTLLVPNAMGERQYRAPVEPTNKYRQWLQGGFIGFYDGFAGPGTGAFWIITSIRLHKIPLLHSCALARNMTFISNCTSLIIFAILVQVNWIIGFIMGLSMMLGSLVGARSAIKFGVRFIKPTFIIVVLLISIKLAFGAWL